MATNDVERRPEAGPHCRQVPQGWEGSRVYLYVAPSGQRSQTRVLDASALSERGPFDLAAFITSEDTNAPVDLLIRHTQGVTYIDRVNARVVRLDYAGNGKVEAYDSDNLVDGLSDEAQMLSGARPGLVEVLTTEYDTTLDVDEVLEGRPNPMDFLTASLSHRAVGSQVQGLIIPQMY